MREVSISKEQAARLQAVENKGTYEILEAYDKVEKELGIYFYQGFYYDTETKERVLIIPFNRTSDQLKLFD